MQTDTASIDKLHAIENLLRNGYKSALVDKTLNKLTEIELSKLNRELDEIEPRIKKFEALYNMDSDIFVENFHSGQAGDSADNIEWISFVDMRTELLKKIRLIQGKND